MPSCVQAGEEVAGRRGDVLSYRHWCREGGDGGWVSEGEVSYVEDLAGVGD